MDLIHAHATIAARQGVADLAHSALPDAPTIPEPEPTTRPAGDTVANFRHGVSVVLRNLADRLDAQSGRTSLPGGAC